MGKSYFNDYIKLTKIIKMVGKMIVITTFKSCLSNLITKWIADEST